MLRYVRFVLAHRRWVIAVVLAISVGAGVVASQGVIASSLIKMFFGENPAYETYRELADDFGSSDLLVVATPLPELDDASGWRSLQRIGRDLERLAYVERVDSVAQASAISADDETLSIYRYGQLGEEDPGGAVAAAVDDAMLRDLLISRDGRHVMVTVELVDDPDRPIERLPQMLEEMIAVFARHGIERERLQLAGTIAETVEATGVARRNFERLTPLTVLVLVVVVYLLFGQLWPVLLTNLVAGVAVLWTLALAVAIEPEINLLIASVPAVMVVISFSDVIHLTSSYLLELRRGMPKHIAIERSGSEVGRACLFTSVTTFAGFVSLVFVPTPIFRQLGIILGAGVGVALLLALTLVPVAFSYMPVPRLTTTEAPALRLVDGIAQTLARLGTRRPLWVIAGFVVVLAVAIAGISRMRVETNIGERLRESNPVRQAQRYIDTHFAGTHFLDLYLWPKDPRADFLDAERFAALQRFTDELENLDGIDRVYSFADVVQRIHDEMRRGTQQGPVIESRPLLSQYLLLFDVSGGEGLDKLIDEERRRVRVVARLKSGAMVRASQTGRQAQALGAQILGEQVEVYPTGLLFMFGDWLHDVVAGQRRGLAFAFAATFALMILALGRLRAGAVSMIPNAMPILALGGYLGWAWETIDSDTMLVGMIAVGIAVDDTIHFTTRLRIEAATSASIGEALERTIASAGRAIVQTTIILCLGFAPFLASDYFTTRILGSLLPLTLIVALLADLLLLPALVQLGIFRLEVGRAADASAEANRAPAPIATRQRQG